MDTLDAYAAVDSPFQELRGLHFRLHENGQENTAFSSDRSNHWQHGSAIKDADSGKFTEINYVTSDDETVSFQVKIHNEWCDVTGPDAFFQALLAAKQQVHPSELGANEASNLRGKLADYLEKHAAKLGQSRITANSQDLTLDGTSTQDPIDIVLQRGADLMEKCTLRQQELQRRNQVALVPPMAATGTVILNLVSLTNQYLPNYPQALPSVKSSTSSPSNTIVTNAVPFSAPLALPSIAAMSKSPQISMEPQSTLTQISKAADWVISWVPNLPRVLPGADGAPLPIKLGLQGSDTDMDGIPDAWEKNGYTVAIQSDQSGIRRNILVQWEDAIHKNQTDTSGRFYIKYKSDPDHWSSTRDPYSDSAKVLGDIDATVHRVAQNPLVATMPVLQMELEDFSVGAVDIVRNSKETGSTLYKGTSKQTGISQTTEWNVHGGLSFGFEGKNPKAEISIGGSYGESTTTFNMMEKTESSQTSQAASNSIEWNTGARATAYGAVRYLNIGTASAHRVIPTVTVSLPISKNYPQMHDVVGTLAGEVNQGQGANVLVLGEVYPDNSKAPVFYSDFSNSRVGSITLLKSQYDRFIKDQQLQFDLQQYKAEVTSSTTEVLPDGNNWNHYVPQILSVTAQLKYRLPANKMPQGNQPLPRNPTMDELEVHVLATSRTPNRELNRPLLSVGEAIDHSSPFEFNNGVYRHGDFSFSEIAIHFDKNSLPQSERKKIEGSQGAVDPTLFQGMKLLITPKGWVSSPSTIFFYKNGQALTGQHQLPSQDDPSVMKSYTFDEYGKILTKETTGMRIDTFGRESYLGTGEDGTGLALGEKATGWKTINETQYYFGTSTDRTHLRQGELAKNCDLELGGKKFQFSSTGLLLPPTGEWSKSKYQDVTYKFTSGHQQGEYARGQVKIDGKSYDFREVNHYQHPLPYIFSSDSPLAEI
ncbi:binary toxin-like calcium binding domain-containing protein [Iodobacter fluviatilis]|uniref:Binary toxin B/toxin PA n=1 Tax=Iodobacter fluviatilis TaxID=537 RepID=A0A377Q5K1_9NEIS|nr:binary toxin-like calcium binding domain-containing protein [Iodobacter fluviatilis]TCU80245.1 binary toxin B/toxin PA [Iodobacter fluviatilis]STQ90203.1 PA-83 [Iodobacter fluviatilis]